MVYGIYNYSIHGSYVHQLITGGHNLVWGIMKFMNFDVKMFRIELKKYMFDN